MILVLFGSIYPVLSGSSLSLVKCRIATFGGTSSGNPAAFSGLIPVAGTVGASIGTVEKCGTVAGDAAAGAATAGALAGGTAAAGATAAGAAAAEAAAGAEVTWGIGR